MRKLFTLFMVLSLSWSVVGCGPPAVVDDVDDPEAVEGNENMAEEGIDINPPEGDMGTGGDEPPPA